MAGILLAAGGKASASWTPADLSNLIVLQRIGVDRDAGRLWQNSGKTTAAIGVGDPVYVSESPGNSDMVATAPGELVILQESGGLWWVSSDDIGCLSVTDGSLAVGTGNWHMWGWIQAEDIGAGDSRFVATGDASSELNIYVKMNSSNEILIFPTYSGTAYANAYSAPALVQAWYDGANMYLQYDSETPINTGASTNLTSGVFSIFRERKPTGSAPAQLRLYQWGFRDVAPTSGERALLYAAGPGA
jgi:hypothetical protein